MVRQVLLYPSADNQKAKVQKISEVHSATKVGEVHTGTNSSSNQLYSNVTYATQDSTMSSVNTYNYPTAANPWGAYTAQSVRFKFCSHFLS